MSNVDKYREEIEDVIRQEVFVESEHGETYIDGWSPAAYRIEKILERALAEQREGIAEELAKEASVPNAPTVAIALYKGARIARNYGKEES